MNHYVFMAKKPCVVSIASDASVAVVLGGTPAASGTGAASLKEFVIILSHKIYNSLRFGFRRGCLWFG